MADNAGRVGHGWTIGGAFAAQAVIIAGVATLLGGASSGQAVSASAGPAPAISWVQNPVSLLPVISMPEGPRSGGFPFTLSIDGQAGQGVFMNGVPTPLSYSVTPGQDLAMTLSVTILPRMRVTGLSVTLAAIGQPPLDQVVYDDPAQPLSAGKHTFTATWAGSASELQSGSTWSIDLSADAPGVHAYNDGTIATVTVGP